MQQIRNTYREDQSSCYFLDLRNSTFITRAISLENGNSKTEKAWQRLEIHADFMLGIHRQIIAKLKYINPEFYHWDNTGDGHFCLIWTEKHAWDVLDIACTVANFLTKELVSYNETLLAWENELKKGKMKLDFGMGMHTGGSLIYEDENKKRYAYGVVMNSASRVEGQTKNFMNVPLLLTQNFYEYLENQQDRLKAEDKRSQAEVLKRIVPVSNFYLDVKDTRPEGHMLYTVRPGDFSAFTT